jgi:hypothetical protein
VCLGKCVAIALDIGIVCGASRVRVLVIHAYAAEEEAVRQKKIQSIVERDMIKCHLSWKVISLARWKGHCTEIPNYPTK